MFQYYFCLKTVHFS